MGYYQWCDNVHVSLRNHEVYHSKEEILEEIENNNKLIEKIKQTLFGLCCGNVKDLLNTKDDEDNDLDPIDVLRHKFDEFFDDWDSGLVYLISHNCDLRYIYDNWDNVQEG